MPDYTLTVGLEVHAELKTRTKMFCDSKNDPDETRPNVNICPVCMGHPGTLPTINKEAVRHVLKVGLALNGKLADFTEFDRKNYFYPDIPKGYQLSQYEFPLVSGGELQSIAITRVHLEEDTATSIHDHSPSPLFRGGTKGGVFSLVDYNRAGVPLMELVTEPVITSAKQAGDFARELQLLLRYLGVSDANMEKGEMRVEANISISKETGKLGTKVEVKNLNSFRAVERAIEYEVARHQELLERGEKVLQETRGWNESTQKTFTQRRKEGSEDYRYFPDPDLPKLSVQDIPEFSLDCLKKEIPELPQERRERYQRAFGVRREDADILVSNRSLGNLFESVAGKLCEPKAWVLASNYSTSDLLGLCKKNGLNADTVSFAFNAESFAELIKMLAGGELSSRAGKDILAVLFEKGGNPRELADALGLTQKNDDEELKEIVAGIISSNEKVVADYRGGKEAALQFLIGQGMKATKGSANPAVLQRLIQTALSK